MWQTISVGRENRRHGKLECVCGRRDMATRTIASLVKLNDGLAGNAPHVRQLKSLQMHFLRGAKPDDHEHLFAEVSKADAEG